MDQTNMRRPIRSPLRMQSAKANLMTQIASDMLNNNLLGKIEEFLAGIRELKEHAERIKNLPKGQKGDKGDSIRGPKGDKGDSIPGPKGKDGISPDPVQVAEIAARLITRPRDGKDAKAPELNAILDALVEKLKTEDILKIEEKMSGVKNEIASYRNQLAGKHYGKDTWARGGGMTMSAGTNITLVPLADGTVQINAAGGSSGSNVTTQYSLTVVQAGANVTIDLSQLTEFATFIDIVAVYRNNIMQTETINFTVAGSTVTILQADAGEVFNVTYSYA